MQTEPPRRRVILYAAGMLRVVSACLRAEHHGTTYIFCSERCRALFDLRPELFAVGGLRVIVERAQERRT